MMQGLIESATAILSASERRLEMVSNNVANVSTPAFKRQVSFSDVMAGRTGGALAGTGAAAFEGAAGRASSLESRMMAQFASAAGLTPSSTAATLPALRARADLAQGKMSATKNPLDLAISGAGFFQVRAGNDIVYSRQGQFRLAEDGTVVTPQGYVLQQAGGGDLVLERETVTILKDGNVLDQDRPVGRIALFAPAEGAEPGTVEAMGGSLFTMAGEVVEVAEPSLRQGMVEASNVSMGDEMVTMMAAVRQAEGGARLVQLYDDLMGRAITAFGQGGQ